MKITRRGWIVLVIVTSALIWCLLDMTTPPSCKVNFNDMSQFCKDFLYR